LEGIATAIAFLRLCKPGPPKLSSYAVKHAAEKWGAKNGMWNYVTNGELIAAAFYLGIAVDESGNDINAGIGISRRGLFEQYV
jgi:hypothetical protein